MIGAVAAIFLLGNATGAWAGSAWKEVKALFSPSINVELNGEQAAGIKALQYNGSLYIPVKSVSDYFGLNSKLEFNKKANKLTIGGPMYLNLHEKWGDNSYQIIVNGNWRPSILTDTRKLYSNYYMGVDFQEEIVRDITLDDYIKQSLADQFKYLHVGKQTDTKISGVDAQVMDYQTSDTVGKLLILQKDADFVSLMFFVDKTRYQASDLKEYDKIISTFNIQ